MSLTMSSATEAPTPSVLPLVSNFGSALAVESVLDEALSETSPPFASSAPAPVTAACVWMLTSLRPSEPATPTEDAPAPDVASASSVCFSPAPFIDAESVAPWTLTPATGTVAVFVICAKLIATAAPIPTELLFAEPSAVAFASVFAALFSVSVPPAVSAAPTVAVDDVVAKLTATAAATATGPSLVEADGVGVEPPPEPPLPDAVELACERSPATWPSTPPDGAVVGRAAGRRRRAGARVRAAACLEVRRAGDRQRTPGRC